MIERLAWLALALVHLTPALALFRPQLLSTLYRLEPGNPLFLLMRHRAALFLVIVVVALWSAIDPAPRRMAVVAVGISMIGFLVLYLGAGSPRPLRKIARIDAAGLIALAIAAFGAFGSAVV